MKKVWKILGIICFLLIVIFLFSGRGKTLPKEKEEPIIKNESWTLTQFGSNEGSQMMCFTIEGNEKGLVIIDGGYRDVEEQHQFLIDKIAEHNNVVDAWIITHFDADHGGEFVRIANEENDVQIKKVYVADTPTDMELLKKNAPYEDDWSVYEDYLAMDLPQKVKVHPGNQYQLIDLKMKVLCSYEDWIDEKTDNLLNNGAIVFKLYGNEESLLFCGDVQSEVIGEYLMENCKNDLKSDYLQVGHHGNNNLGDEFYREVSPKIAFFAAPDWLMENVARVPWYTVEENRAVLEETGAEILWHNTSPNQILFQLERK